MDKQKRRPSETAKTNNRDAEEGCLADIYKRMKVSSARKIRLTPQKRSSMRLRLDETQSPGTSKSCSIKCGNLTPSLGKRNSALVKPATPLQEARSRLHVSAIPKSLPCREEEFNNIFTFLRGKLEDKSCGWVETNLTHEKIDVTYEKYLQMYIHKWSTRNR